MNSIKTGAIFDISPAALNPIASQILNADATAAKVISSRKIGRSAGGATVGVFRVMGTAESAGGEQSWSAIAKVLGPKEYPRAGVEMDAYRELAVYRTGVFAELHGGLRSAACYGAQAQDDLQILWIEDLSDAPQAPWLPQYFIEAARHLGGFNAHWPEDGLPAWEWLDQASFRQQFINQLYSTTFEQLAARRNEPFVRRACPLDVAERLLALWEQSDMLFGKVDATSRCVCHADCHPKNLFPMGDSTGKTFTIGIDWELVGIGCLGLDIGHLLASPIGWLELPLEQAAVLVEGIFEAYIVGLREAGWAGNEEQVRLAYLARLGCEAMRRIRVVLAMADRPEVRDMVEQFLKHPTEEILDRWAEGQRFYLDYSDKALQLAKRF
jgi:hypothetical protein